MNRDTLFWSAVGALALGTALLTAHRSLPSDTEETTVAGEVASHDGPRAAATGSAFAARSSRGKPNPVAPRPTHSSRVSPAQVIPPASHAEVREALAELVRASRARAPGRRASSPDVEIDPTTRMPLAGMTFEQYRVWAKLGRMMAERDYRAVVEHDPPLGEIFDEPTVEAMLDSVAADYADYLAGVVEGGCDALEPSSLWRKTAFMSLWLGKLERYSPELAAQEQAALGACGY